MPKITVLLVLVAAIAVGSASGPGPAKADTTTPSTYIDPTGDSASAPDVTKVTITPGNGTAAFDVAFTGTLGSDGQFAIVIDADRNPQTGNHGFDYLYLADSTGGGFGKWDGTQWANFTHQPTNPGMTSTDLTFTITLADIGGVSTFDFVAGSLRGNDADTAPDSGVATYPIAVAAPPPPPPPAPAPTPTPTPTVKALLIPSGVLLAKAGKVLRVPRLQLLLTDGTTATADTQACTLKLKGKKLPALAGGCAWKIPKAYKKARLVLTITYSYGGKAKTTSWPVYPR
jgi:hypothetical protein